MHRAFLLPFAVAATFLASCAPMDNKTDSVGQTDEKTHVTGSRLPVREGNTSATVDTQTNSGGWVPAGNVNVQPKGGH